MGLSPGNNVTSCRNARKGCVHKTQSDRTLSQTLRKRELRALGCPFNRGKTLGVLLRLSLRDSLHAFVKKRVQCWWAHQLRRGNTTASPADSIPARGAVMEGARGPPALVTSLKTIGFERMRTGERIPMEGELVGVFDFFGELYDSRWRLKQCSSPQNIRM
jgi:hypothetical protein